MKALFNLYARLDPTHALLRELSKPHYEVPDLDRVAFAISQGANLNAKNREGQTGVYLCTQKYLRMMQEEKTIPLRQAIEGQGNLAPGFFAKRAEVFQAAGEKLLEAGADPRIGATGVLPRPLQALEAHSGEKGADRFIAAMQKNIQKFQEIEWHATRDMGGIS